MNLLLVLVLIAAAYYMIRPRWTMVNPPSWPGGPKKTLTKFDAVPTINECKKKCMEKQECNSIAYSVGSKECYLFSGATSVDKTPDGGWTSGMIKK